MNVPEMESLLVNNMKIQEITIGDCSDVFDLYKRVVSIPGGLARLSNEITEEYIHNFITNQ